MVRRIASIRKGEGTKADVDVAQTIHDNSDEIQEGHNTDDHPAIPEQVTKKKENIQIVTTKENSGKPDETSQAQNIDNTSESMDVTPNAENANKSVWTQRSKQQFNINMLKTPKGFFQKAKLLRKSLSKSKEIFVSYWDLGGDELYYATHQIHLSPDAVYLLVFDMSKMDKEDERKKQLGLYIKFCWYLPL